ncbi:hypothetical protein H4R99_000848 [Coemansia sp. RSA 1722]|nr:hypothetical protein IWW45_004703 [Coemansia sp. RSA 485]KAJ2605844.1 hypothetical protein H4R99_000848 [Coemansia sp. RSA 1722]KAJ2638912.1 hypothetical protein GGF40_001315 [Coemansia sp. RSA 1286]
MDFGIVPLYRAIFERRQSLEAQQMVEYEAREADRQHRERVRDLKHRRLTETPIWIPSKLRPRKNSDQSSNCASPPVSPTTTIRWADSDNTA